MFKICEQFGAIRLPNAYFWRKIGRSAPLFFKIPWYRRALDMRSACLLLENLPSAKPCEPWITSPSMKQKRESLNRSLKLPSRGITDDTQSSYSTADGTALSEALLAIRNDEAPITHVMRKAVSGKRKPEGVSAIFGVDENHVLGPQTRNANRTSMAVSISAARRG